MDRVVVYDDVFAVDKDYPNYGTPIPDWYLDYMASMWRQETCENPYLYTIRSKEEALDALQPFLKG